MPTSKGDTLPEATLLRMGENGPEEVALKPRLAGRKVVIFALPGAYTGTCTTAHVPSFINAMEGLKAKGVDEVICIAVNDPFVMKQWGEDTGATEAGITMLADPSSAYTKAVDMAFTAPPVGFFDRSKRYALVAEDGVVKTVQEDDPGTCNLSGGDAILDTL
ncbi:peroxiredoxin [Palleronia abyssalis]|uniref:Glutathione-dependent peroxiredoxin n=1 Tax=Palleronia abyssalis TaxID=1501240 RepID=A0A2R8BSF8_9RHOB|nr:peroxiredoxin [Palleronia abyssalis]SPJ23071.1 Putative peroxiredoxin [Palleronia abyssalis]